MSGRVMLRRASRPVRATGHIRGLAGIPGAACVHVMVTLQGSDAIAAVIVTSGMLNRRASAAE